MVHLSIGKSRTGAAFLPQSVASGATVAGPTISKAPRVGRTLEFVLVGGAIAATALHIRVQGRINPNASWEDIQDQDGNPVEFGDTITTGGLGLVNGSLKGTIMLDRLAYDDYRLSVNSVGGASLVAATYSIEDRYDNDTNQKDHLLWKVTPYTETEPVDALN